MMESSELVETILRELGLGAARASASPLHGGDINRAWRLDVGVRRFFVKVNRAELLPMFEAEETGLDAIRNSRSIRVPEVFATGSAGANAYIVMEYIELGGRPDGERLARALAAMHHFGQDRFGFDCDNTIGSTPQINTWHADWIEFWRTRRLGFQLELAASRGADAAMIDAGAALGERLPDFFAGYRPRASLLHGDLWSGNQGADAAGEPVIYDPACYYGDHEADLAMMELFGSPGQRFFSAYHDLFPIDHGYRLRRELYNLYHILNHYNLFGGGYAHQAHAMIRKLLAAAGD